jgi:hypothetical protein
MLDTELLEPRRQLHRRPASQPARTCHKEMGCTAQQLLRMLPAVAGHEPLLVERNRGQAVIGGAERKIVVNYAPRPHRRLGSLRLPVLDVDMHFHGFSDARARAFLTRFDRCFLRMGG